MRSKLTIVIVSVVSMAGCAKSPDNIQALPLSDLEFQNMSCSRLKQVNDETAVDLKNLTVSQERASANDALGVLFVGAPLASMTGQDYETTLAYTKGKMEAIQRVLKVKGC
jgi:orotate phosphoribosyltransferase-like protein